MPPWNTGIWFWVGLLAIVALLIWIATMIDVSIG